MFDHPVLLVEARNDCVLFFILVVDDVPAVAETDQLKLSVIVDSVLHIMVLTQQVLRFVLIVGFVDLIVIKQFVVHDDLVAFEVDEHGRAHFRLME